MSLRNRFTASYRARNEIELRWSNKSLLGEAIYGGVGWAFQGWDAKTAHACGESFINRRKLCSELLNLAVVLSFWYRAMWQRGRSTGTDWQKSCSQTLTSRLASSSSKGSQGNPNCTMSDFKESHARGKAALYVGTPIRHTKTWIVAVLCPQRAGRSHPTSRGGRQGVLSPP